MAEIAEAASDLRLQTNRSEVIRAAVTSGMGIGYSPTGQFEREHSAKVKAFVEHVAAAFMP